MVCMNFIFASCINIVFNELRQQFSWNYFIMRSKWPSYSRIACSISNKKHFSIECSLNTLICSSKRGGGGGASAYQTDGRLLPFAILCARKSSKQLSPDLQQ